MWEAVLGIGSIALGAYSSSRQADAAESQSSAQAEQIRQTAEANRKISLYDAAVAEKEAVAVEIAAGIELRNHQRTVDRLLGSTKAGLAKQGVVVNAGSALDVMVDIAREGARDADVIRYNGKTKAQRYRSMAQRYRMLADAGLRDAALQASLVEEAGESRAEAYTLTGIADTMKAIYELWG